MPILSSFCDLLIRYWCQLASACLRTLSCIEFQPLFIPALCSSETNPSAV